MSKSFLVFIKFISFIVGIGFIIFYTLPIIGDLLFTIGLGGIDNILSSVHIVLYVCLAVSIIVVILLIKIIKEKEDKKIIKLAMTIVALIFICCSSLILWSNHENKMINLSKQKALEEEKIFLRDHCTKISPESTAYKCDDGSIR